MFSRAKSVFERLTTLAGGNGSLRDKVSDRVTGYGQLFSHAYYCSQVPDLNPENAIEHFESIGWREGLSPHPLFSTRWYLRHNQYSLDENPLSHWLKDGLREGINPHPLFDVRYYAKISGVDFAADSKPGTDPLTHYVTAGWQDNLSPHPLVSFYYCRRPRQRIPADIEPLTYAIRKRFKHGFHPHPMFSGGRLATQLRLRGRRVKTQNLAEQFGTWSASTSPSPLFDQAFYVSQNPDAADYPGGPFQHFVYVGQFQQCDPTPYFCSEFYVEQYGDALNDAPSPFMHYMAHEATLKFKPSEDFHVAHYDATNPGVRKSGKSLLEHFLNNGRFVSREIRKNVVPYYLMQHIREAEEIDPSIRFTPAKLKKLKVVNRHQAVKVAEYYDVLRGELKDAFKVLVMAPFLKRGGADLVAVNLVRCLHQQFGKDEVLLILTDDDDLSAEHWLPEGTRRLTLSHIERTMSLRERERLLQLIVDEYRPQICYNVNSGAGWELFTRQGRGLSKLTKLAAFLFCFDYREENVPVGYAMQHLPKAVDHLEEVYVDNGPFREELISTFGFPPSKHNKLKVVYQPTRDFGCRLDTEATIARLGRDDSYRRQIFWAGRMDRQKRPDIMLEIAKRCPQFDFHVHGMQVLDALGDLESSAPPNVTFHGEFPDTFKLPLQEADIFLYTSQWDGLPTLLIDIAQAGVPTIAADSGGVRELINNETGWLVDHVDNVDAYVAGLEEISRNPAECRKRLEAGRQLIQQQHHWDSYSRHILQFARSNCD